MEVALRAIKRTQHDIDFTDNASVIGYKLDFVLLFTAFYEVW